MSPSVPQSRRPRRAYAPGPDPRTASRTRTNGPPSATGPAIVAFAIAFIISTLASHLLVAGPWWHSLANAAALGTAAAGLELLLIATRRRRELEGPDAEGQ